MKKKITVLAAVAILIGFASFSQAPSRFQRFDFKVKGEITDVVTEDLNGDNLKEIIVIHIDKTATPPRRYLTIYPYDKKTGFDRARKIEWMFPREVAAMDVGDVSPDPGRELVFITEKGVSFATVDATKVGLLQTMLAVQSVVAIPYDRDVPYYNFVRDYTGDGKDDVLVVGFYEALMAKQEAGYAFSQSKIHLRPSMDLETFDMSGLMGGEEHPVFRVAYYVPQVYVEDYNADGLVDLIVNFRGEVQIFAQTKAGFTPDPAKRYQLRLFPERGFRRQQSPNFVFEDLDKDRRMDIVVNQVFGDIANMKGRTVVYFGKSAGVEKAVPDLELKTKAPSMGVFIHDVNKDGLLDIILPTIDFSAWTAGKALVTGDFTVDWAYFIQNPNRTFNAAPTRLTPTTLKFNVSKFRLENGIPNIFGDFNGDGYPDLALGEDKNILGISCRDGQGRPIGLNEKVAVPVSIVNRAVDLNLDGKSDLVIFYPEMPDFTGELHVLLNRGPWTLPK